MNRREWRKLMTRWSAELMGSSLAEQVRPVPDSPDWLGFEPADEEDIKRLEERLGVILPPSYRSFLAVSNGWRRATFAIDRIRPVDEVDWFRVENENSAEVYADTGSDHPEVPDAVYYAYPDGSAPDYRPDHLRTVLQISDVDDAVYLLNPEAVTPEGEWEAWFFANWVPGAERYPSFAHLMLNEYRSFARLENFAVQESDLPHLPIPGPDVPRVAAERVKPVRRAESLDALIRQLSGTEGKALEAALRRFRGKLRGRSRAERRPDLVPALVELYHASPVAHVRCACIQAITELAEEPPPLLLESLSDPEPWVISWGIYALHAFPNPLALEPLCRFVQSRANVLINEKAMSALGEIGDEHAVPTLAGVLLDASYPFAQGFGTAAFALSRCGPEGFAVLVSALEHADPCVRVAAVSGIDFSGHPDASELLDRMTRDADPAVRERAKERRGKFLNW